MENKPEICHENYRVVFENEELYVDNQSRKRSGHMTHAMTELSSDAFIDFNSNSMKELIEKSERLREQEKEIRISPDNRYEYKPDKDDDPDLDLLKEALKEFGCGIEYLKKGAEACDVTIRCYLLSSAISEVIDELGLED